MISSSRRWGCIGLALLLLVQCHSAFADDADKNEPELAQQVTKLVEQLSSLERAERDAAMEKLTSMGEDILPLLPAIDSLPHASARASLRRVRVVLERRAALGSLEPSHVMWVRDATLDEFVAELSTQTGNDVVLNVSAELARRVLSPPEKKLSFWSAMTWLEQQAGLTSVSDGGTIKLVNRKNEPTLRSIAQGEVDAFRWIMRTASFKTLPGDDAKQLLRLALELQAEPRLRPLFLKYRMNQSLLTAGETHFAPFSPDAVIELPWGRGEGGLSIRFDYLIDRNQIGSQLRLQIPLDVEIATGTSEVVFRDLHLAEEAERKGGALVARGEMERTQEGLRVPLLLAYETGGPAFESHRNWVYHNRLVLETGEKKYRPDAPVKMTLESDGVLGLEYGFRNPPDDWREARLRYRFPILLTSTRLKLQTSEFVIPSPQKETP